MGVFFDLLIIDLVAVLATILCLLYAYFKYCFTYWEKRNVPSIPASFPFGNQAEQFLLRKSPGELHSEFYVQARKHDWKFVGLYGLHRPYLMILDPELVKDVLSRDFEHFHDRRVHVDEKNDPLTAHLLGLKGMRWKNLRAKLTPTFTSGKMKQMFHTMAACSDGLNGILDEHSEQKKPIDIKEVLCRFTTDIIGSCAFGIECNSLRDPNNIFRLYGKQIFEPTTWQTIKSMFVITFPKISKFFGLKRTRQHINQFFIDLVRDTVEYRQKNNVQRPDFMQLLIQMKNDDEQIDTEGEDAGKTLSLNGMTAQAFVFFVAGFETSSTTMTFVLHDLALHQDIQDKVREEVNAMLKKYDGQLTYDGIMELTYMDKVIQETQRFHAPIPLIGRICTKDYTIRGTNVLIEKDTSVVVPVLGLQTDPEFYPEPDKYDPERFSPEQKDNRHHYTFLPFGEGPRNCIGLRFGLLQSKVGLAVVLSQHRVRLSPKTKTPLKFSPTNIIKSVVGDVWLDVERID